RRPLSSPLFPYTTLFRSVVADVMRPEAREGVAGAVEPQPDRRAVANVAAGVVVGIVGATARIRPPLEDRLVVAGARFQHEGFRRSEEHTSELQSRENLVC